MYVHLAYPPDIAGILDGEHAFIGPEHVVIDVTNRCNNNCIACWTRSPLLLDEEAPPEWKKQTLSYRVLSNLIDDLSDLGTRRIRFTGGGEPLMHHKAIDLLAKIKEKKMIGALTTNFTLITKEKVKAIVDMELDELTVSLWAATPQTYSITHPNKLAKTFNYIKDHLMYLNSIKKNSKPFVTIANVIFGWNFFEMFDMVKFAYEVGADAVYFAVVDVIPRRTDCLLLRPEQRNHILTYEIPKIREFIESKERKLYLDNFEEFIRRISSDNSQAGNYDLEEVDKLPCYVGWIFCRILPNGDVAPCCRAVDKPMGNLNEKSFKDIWFSKEYNYFRKMALTKKKSHPYFAPIKCYKTCDNLMHNKEAERRLKELNIEKLPRPR